MKINSKHLHTLMNVCTADELSKTSQQLIRKDTYVLPNSTVLFNVFDVLKPLAVETQHLNRHSGNWGLSVWPVIQCWYWIHTHKHKDKG